VILYGWINPHAIKERKRLEYFNDVMMMQLAYSMICMTSYMLDLELSFYFGYVFMTISGVMVVGNFAYITNSIANRFVRNRKLSKLK